MQGSGKISIPAWFLKRFTGCSICLFLLITGIPFAKSQHIEKDTIILKEVEVKGYYPSLPGIKKIRIEETGTNIDRLSDITSYAKLLPSVQIRTSGPGSSSVAYIRGAGASHTNVTWNGVVLNSPMTGQADLSLFPSLFSDGITLLAGNNSSFSRNPAIGGTICIDNEADWKNPDRKGIILSAGSFGNISGGIHLSCGNRKIISRIRIFGRNDMNRFSYMNNAVLPNEEMKLTGAFIRQGAVQHELYFRKKRNQFSLMTWAGYTDREIPPLMTNVTAATHDEFQRDRFVRLSGSAEWYMKKISFYVKPSVSVSELKYDLTHKTDAGSICSANSISQGNDFYLHEGINIRLDKTIIRTWNSTGLQSAFVSDVLHQTGYRHYRIESTQHFNAEQPIGKSFEILASMHTGITGNDFTMPAPSLHLYYRPQNMPAFYVSAGRNFRYPSLNDLYFIPGGNPDLKRESSVSYEAGMEDCIFKIAGSCLNVSSSVFYQEIEDWILWQPSQFGFWRPCNIRNATSAGISVSADWTKEFRNGKFIFDSQYTFNTANADDDEYETGQPVYLPVHNAHLRAECEVKKWNFGTTTMFMSERKTSLYKNTWSPVLEPVWIQNFAGGRKFSTGKCNFNAGFRVENVFDVQWQQVLWRPMPGRSFQISFNFEL